MTVVPIALLQSLIEEKKAEKPTEQPKRTPWLYGRIESCKEISPAFTFAKSVNQLLQSQQMNSGSFYLFSKAIFKAVWYKNPCFSRLCKTDEKTAAAFAGTLLKRQAAWSYQENPTAIAHLKKVAPWKDTPYAKEKDMFAQARADLFTGKNKKYSPTPIECFITTPDNIMLNGIYFPGKAKKVILLAVGLTAMYEECMIDYVYDKHVSFFKEKCGDPSVLIINTRGIGISQGTSTPQTMPLDIYSAYKFLIKHFKFDPEDVLTYGHSLGGLYGLQGAAFIQIEYPNKKISAVVDRSFVSLADVGEAHVQTVRCGRLLGWFARRLIMANGLNFNSQSAAEILTGKVVALVSKKDTTIPYKASFPVKLARNSIQLKVIELSSDEEKIDHHIRPFTEKESQEIATAIQGII